MTEKLKTGHINNLNFTTVLPFIDIVKYTNET